MFQEDLCNHRGDHKMFQGLPQQHLSYIARMYTGHDSTDHFECRPHFPLDSEHKETCGSIFLKNKLSTQVWFGLSLVDKSDHKIINMIKMIQNRVEKVQISTNFCFCIVISTILLFVPLAYQFYAKILNHLEKNL